MRRPAPGGRLQPLLAASIVFACSFGGALAGLWLRRRLPDEHLGPDARDVVKLGIGLVATLTALVLGLVTASAKSAFDLQDGAVKTSTANVLLLDRTLARYGPETRPIRDLLRAIVERRLEATWPSGDTRARVPDAADNAAGVDAIENGILALKPATDAQRWLRERALSVGDTLAQARWLSSTGARSAIPVPFLVALGLWVTVIFTTFGLLTPPKATVVVVLLICSASVAISIFLILEMETPFSGLMKVSGEPLRYALAHLGG